MNELKVGAGFDGPDYDPELDHKRLTGQILRVFICMRDGQWRSLRQIEHLTGDPAASISAQLRHLRKEKFGSHVIEKKRAGNRTGGLFVYRLIVTKPAPTQLSLV